jgi:hypothetical protein
VSDYVAYFAVGKNGKGKPIEVFQPNLRAARVTRDRLIHEGVQDVKIERWDYSGERTYVE